MKQPKTLDEARKELKDAVDRLHEARMDFMRAYRNSITGQIPRPQMERYTMTFSKQEDGLPKQMVEDEDWN